MWPGISGPETCDKRRLLSTRKTYIENSYKKAYVMLSHKICIKSPTFENPAFFCCVNVIDSIIQYHTTSTALYGQNHN